MTQMTQMTWWQEASQTIDRMVYLRFHFESCAKHALRVLQNRFKMLPFQQEMMILFQEISKSVLWGAWDLRRVKSWNLVTHNLYNYLFKYICTHTKTFKRKKNKLKHISYYEKCTKRRIIMFCAMFTIFIHYYVM